MTTIFTIGHSTRGIEELIDLLRANGVGMLVDVRRFPGSRRHPQFNRESLEASLPAAGIRYRHEPDMGGRREGRRDSPNQGWRNASFRAYADHMESAGFRAAFQRLWTDAAAGVTEEPDGSAGLGAVAIMCAEAVPWRCHRNLISDALVAAGAEVRHIISESSVTRHELNAMARVGPEGRLTYPGEPAEQPDLF